MHSRFILVIVCVVGMSEVAARAQITSPPPICFAFNDPGTAAPGAQITLDCTGFFEAHFVAPASSFVERIDVYRAGAQWSFTNVAIFATPSLGAPPTGTPIGTYFGCAAYSASQEGWDACWIYSPTNTAIAFTAGTTYAARITVGPCGPQNWGYCTPGGCYTFSYDPAGTQPLPYAYAAGVCSPSIGPSGQIPLSLRFRSLTCGPGPLASITVFAGSVSGCGGTLPIAVSSLSFSGPPVLGLPLFVSILGPPGETAYLLWSAGLSPTGIPVAPGSPCGFHLHIPSFTALAAAGAEPLASGFLSPIPWPYGGPFTGGTVTWGFTVPGSPAYAGLSIGVQAVVVGPSGTLALAPGVTGQLTGAVLLGLGY
jgi:hypothetical protein